MRAGRAVRVMSVRIPWTACRHFLSDSPPDFVPRRHAATCVYLCPFMTLGAHLHMLATMMPSAGVQKSAREAVDDRVCASICGGLGKKGRLLVFWSCYQPIDKPPDTNSANQGLCSCNAQCVLLHPAHIAAELLTKCKPLKPIH